MHAASHMCALSLSPSSLIHTYTHSHTHHVALQFPYESLFRSIQFALMENACRDYLFVVEFFSLTPSTAQDFFDSIFGRTLAYLLVR